MLAIVAVKSYAGLWAMLTAAGQDQSALAEALEAPLERMMEGRDEGRKCAASFIWQVLAAAPAVAASTGSACHAGDHAATMR